ncbi:MAG: adventurous gliding motility lipoprotein CglB [Archangiaceae bacterium]|nr:adventurous gliding motility lipoprotein CglB [Archangiaceae bacterium]
MRALALVTLAGLAAATLAVSVGCGKPPTTCSAQSCEGCCDPYGVCRNSSRDTCGSDGAACVQCQPQQMCTTTGCVEASTGGGSSGTGGGTSGTGGGTSGTGGGTSGTGGGTSGTGGGTSGTGGGTSGTGGGTSGTAGGTSGTGGGAGGRAPNVMILFDKSGSMAQSTKTGCACMFPNCDEVTCPTRIGQVRAGMSTFLTSRGTSARFGLTTYPADTVCTAAGSTTLLARTSPVSDSPTDLQAWSNGINTQIQGLSVAGGTPTAASLTFVGTLPELVDSTRSNWVLLITDGLPNCNLGNPNNCTNPSLCKCTLTAGQCGSALSADGGDSNFCVRGCLDQSASAGATASLRAKNIRTIVVGFGADFDSTSDGFAVLNDLASAGGYVRRCPNGNECGSGNTCLSTTHTCAQAFYKAQTTAELSAALAEISATIALP